jgi:hypothetical protein
VGPLFPGSVLKEAARDAANEQTNLAESFPMLGTASVAEDDAGNKYFLASPNCAPAAVPPNRALHSLCFEQRPAAKNSSSPIPFHLFSLGSPFRNCTCYRLRHLKKADEESYFYATANWFVWSVERAGGMPYVPIQPRHPVSRFFLHHSQTPVGRS